MIHVERLEDEIADTKSSIFPSPARAHECIDMRQFLEDELGETVTILATIYPLRDFTLIDILPPDSSKGSGLKSLLRSTASIPKEVMAIGDNFNDLEMLEFAGTAVVMGNADPSLLEREEFYTTLSNDEGGVAAAIEQFILKQENI